MEASAEGGRAGQLGPGSKGFMLLQKAGWKGKGGLGKDEQGRQSPVPVKLLKGRRGIGSEPPKPKRAKATERTAVVSNRDANAQRRPNCSDEEAKRVAVAVYREFKEVDASVADRHPLRTKNRLSSRNPLLEDDD